MTTYGGTREFAMKVARLSRAMLDEPSVEGTLQGIVELAARTVDGVTSAGITIVLGDGTLATRAYTDEVVLKVDGAQSRFHEDPCLSVGKQPRQAVFKIDDMSAERRWPRFAGEAMRLGVGSMIARRIRRAAVSVIREMEEPVTGSSSAQKAPKRAGTW